MAAAVVAAAAALKVVRWFVFDTRTTYVFRRTACTQGVDNLPMNAMKQCVATSFIRIFLIKTVYTIRDGTYFRATAITRKNSDWLEFKNSTLSITSRWLSRLQLIPSINSTLNLIKCRPIKNFRVIAVARKYMPLRIV